MKHIPCHCHLVGKPFTEIILDKKMCSKLIYLCFDMTVTSNILFDRTIEMITSLAACTSPCVNSSPGPALRWGLLTTTVSRCCEHGEGTISSREQGPRVGDWFPKVWNDSRLLILWVVLTIRSRALACRWVKVIDSCEI